MYGKFLPGSSNEGDKYGFLNEYQVRLGAGITLAFAVYSFISVLFFAQYTLPLIFVGIMWLDFVIKVINPKYSIIGNIAKLFVKKVSFVGAIQKRFAWSIGLVLSTITFICLLITSGFLAKYNLLVSVYQDSQTTPILPYTAVHFTLPILVCVICIIFMFLEAVFGYCVGCKIYKKLVQKGVIKQKHNQNCAGDACKLD